MLSAGDSAPATSAGVEVVTTAQVAGMDAAVLSASDPEALLTWLREHDYAARDALLGWVEPYVSQGWMITAFKIAKEPTAQAAFGTRAVKMSFDTDRPFYPYREPADHPEQGSRSLRVWFVSDARYEGGLGRDSGTSWDSAEALWSAPLERASSILGGVVYTEDQPAHLHLTEFLDRASPRDDADLFFRVDEDQSVVRRPPRRIPDGEVPFPLPVEPLALAAVGAWLWRRRRRGA